MVEPGATPAPDAPTISTSAAREGLPDRIGHYAVTRKLGEGGMGVVYAARDERLGRTVALKTMSSLSTDETARRRFWREARAAASVNHPNVCQIYEIGEDRGELFIAMEFLEGSTLTDLMRQGPLTVAQTMPIGLGILAALSALHARGVVHRDLKPSNVFLTSHGVKLLDFGLAQPDLGRSLSLPSDLTRPGVVIGTPRYMAPEQVTDAPVDARADLFATGAILFEMLSGRPAFGGRTVLEILHATVNEQPPALTGSPVVAAIDRIIRKALAKRPQDRPASADAMAAELGAVRGVDSDSTPALAHALTRLVVLPFRVLRPDPDSDFLAFSLSDAIATSLSGISSIVVRSSAVAARFARGEAPDLKALAAEADVDRVVMGTLSRSGDQLRATAQLVEAPGGTLLTAHTVQSSFGDLFRMQDDIARRVVDALSLPLSGRGVSPAPDSPHHPQAYEFYLRANELARTYDGLDRAREWYLKSLELDPNFAPAWARLGRCYRVMGKFVDGAADSEVQAENALRRALELNPRLTLAHKFYANLEADMGQARRALLRLAGEANRHGNDPDLFAGLVHACRYCGLFEQSIAAHAEARRLDPNVPTGVEQTLLMSGDLDELTAMDRTRVDPGGDAGIRVMALGLAGHTDEAKRLLQEFWGSLRVPVFQAWKNYLLAWLEGRSSDMVAGIQGIGQLKIQLDPEAMFMLGWLLCDVGKYDEGLAYLQRAVTKGYSPAATLASSQQFDRLRGNFAFQTLLADAVAGRQRALSEFREIGGDRLIGELVSA
jgi:non-specific serine/threonine protein kinase